MSPNNHLPSTLVKLAEDKQGKALDRDAKSREYSPDRARVRKLRLESMHNPHGFTDPSHHAYRFNWVNMDGAGDDPGEEAEPPLAGEEEELVWVDTPQPPNHYPALPGFDWWFPPGWVMSDQLPAVLLKCKTLGEFHDMLIGKHQSILVEHQTDYLKTLLGFLKQSIDEYKILGKATEEEKKTAKMNLPLQQHKEWLDRYCKNPAYWKLIEENPRDFISRDAVRDLGPLKITVDSGDTTFRTAVILNHLKMLYWILRPQHLGRRLNVEGEYGGKSYEMWIYAAMIAVRLKAKFKRVMAKPKKQDWVQDLQEMVLQKSDLAPHLKLQPTKKLVTKSEAEEMQTAVGNTEAAVDDIPLVQPDMFADLEEDEVNPVAIAQLSDEDFIRNMDEFNAWFIKNNIQMDAPMFDQELRNVKQRPHLSRAQVDRVIQQAMLHVEVVADGTHERLAKHSADLKNQLGQIIALESDATENSTTLGPDDTTKEQNDARENERKEAHRAFGLFQSMLTGVWDANVCAPTYREACKELELKPTDPHWMVEGVKCGLKPWQVIGVEWLRTCRDRIGINPLLADDCGLGKTMQGLGGIYAEYLRLKDQPREIRGPFRPSLVVCPRMLAMNWVEDNKQLLNGALEVYMWAGRAVDAGNMVDRVHFIDGSAEDLQKIISDMDPDDPKTARTVFVTSYTTGWKRGLLQNGHPVIPAKQQKEIQDRARKEQAEQIRKEQAEEDAAEDSDEHMHIATPPPVGEDQPQTGVESVSLALRLEPKFSTLLEGLFERVICDESHKIKSTKGRSFEFVEALKPTSGCWFLSATPMSNNIEDLTPYLMLNWDEEFMQDPSVDPAFAHNSIGLKEQYPNGKEEDPDAPRQDCACPNINAILNPALFKKLTPKGTMTVEVSKQYLPTLLRRLAHRRTMASMIDSVDENGEDCQIRIGEHVPDFVTRTIEVAYKDQRLRDHHHKYQAPLVQSVKGEDPTTVPSPQRNGDPQGKRNMATHKRLQVMTLSAHLEPFTISYMAQKQKMGVVQTNTLHEYGHDKGLSILQCAAQADPNTSIYSSRYDMALWLLRWSPKLAWLCQYVNECYKNNERVAIFAQWPVTQWLIEGVLELLGFEYRSIRSEKTVKLRQEAVAEFVKEHTTVVALVCSYATAALGINIQKYCFKIIHVELPHNMSTVLSANGRAHRLGQTKKQEFFILCLDSSYDMTIMARIAKKYRPELAATLRIPEDAMIGNDTRPSAEFPTERRQFDDAYVLAVLCDLYGQSWPVVNYPDINDMPTRSNLFGTATDVDGKAVPEPTFTIPPPATKASRGSGKSTQKSRKRKAGDAEIDDSPLPIRFPKAKKTPAKDKHYLSDPKIVDSPEEPSSPVIAAADTPTRTLIPVMGLEQDDNYQPNATPPTPAYGSQFGTPEEHARREGRLRKLELDEERGILLQDAKDDAEAQAELQRQEEFEARKAAGLRDLDAEAATVLTQHTALRAQLNRNVNGGPEQAEEDTEGAQGLNGLPEKDNGLEGALGGVETETEANNKTSRRRGGGRGRGKNSAAPAGQQAAQSRRRSNRTRNNASRSYQDPADMDWD